MTAVEPIQAAPASVALPRSERGVDPAGGPRRIRVGIIGATGYVGGELVRLLARHPNVEIVGLVGRDRDHDPIDWIHPHLATTELTVDAALPADPAAAPDAVFMALPHGEGVEVALELAAAGTAVIDLGPDFRLRDAADYPRWYGFEHPRPDLLDIAVYGLPGAPSRRAAGAWSTPRSPSSARPAATRPRRSSPCSPLARAGLIGDLVVDAKSGVSGAGREASPS